jgi:hypothetical protein
MSLRCPRHGGILRILVLVLLFVLAQAGAAAHALSHLESADDGGMPEPVCV